MKTVRGFLIIVLAGLALAGPARAALPVHATLTEVRGDVQVSTAVPVSWHGAEKGMRLGNGALVMTGSDGSAELVFDDASALRLEKNTRLTVHKAERRQTFREMFVEVLNGRLLINVPKINKYGQAKFKVKTPLSSAAIRGTVFVMDSGPQTDVIAVYEGKVEAEGALPGGNVEVGAGQQTDVKAGGSPGAPHPLSAEMESYRQAIADLFAARIEEIRQDMDALKRLNQEYMDSHRKAIQDDMDTWRKEMERRMRERRENTAPQ
jgi:hypothetical protein